MTEPKEFSPHHLEPSQILVRQIAAPMNPADFNMVEGTYGYKVSLPAIGGNEGLFEVIYKGRDVPHTEGDWVVPVNPGVGTWASHAVVDAQEFIKIPKVIPADQAAVSMINPCTAYRMLMDFVNLGEGDVVVQNGATSAVGTSVIQIAKARGLKTINIVRSRDNFAETRDYLMSLGATLVLEDSMLKDKDAIAQALRDAGLGDKPSKLGLNCVSGTSTVDLCRFMAPNAGAVVVTYGGMSKKPVMIGTGSFIFADLTFKGFWMTRWNQQHAVQTKERQAMYSYIFHLISEGKFKIPTSTVEISTQEDVTKAVEMANSAHKGSKVLVTFPKDD